MAALEVLTNKDLVENIYGAGFCRNHDLILLSTHEWMLLSIRELVTGAKVCRVFREACLVHLKRAWGGYERQMRGFDKCGNECQNLVGEALVAKLRELGHEYGQWPEYLFGFDADMVRSATTADTLTLRYYIKEVMQFVRPTTYDEMLYMMEGKCACCGGRCTYNTRAGNHWRLGDQLSASGAPVHGKIVCTHFDSTCGCPVYAVQKQAIPHTWSGHIAMMVFLRDEDGDYRMRIRLEWCAPMSPGERDAHHFIVGARNQPWYQPRIKRLFELRPARVIHGLRCCHRGRVALSGRFGRGIEFSADVFLLTPRLPNNADWSLQQIFGLSREETLACVRRGRLILRERRLLGPVS